MQNDNNLNIGNRILTVPETETYNADILLTANEYVAFPEIDALTGSIRHINVLHQQSKSLIEWVGDPFLKPMLSVDRSIKISEGLSFLFSTYDAYFIPTWSGHDPSRAFDYQWTILAPPGYKGFALKLSLKNNKKEAVKVEMGIEGIFTQSFSTIFSRRRLSGVHRAYLDPWTKTFVLEVNDGHPVAALALCTDRGHEWYTSPSSPFSRHAGGGEWLEEEGTPYFFHYQKNDLLQPEEEIYLVFYGGVGSEGDGASLNAVHMMRIGWEKLYEETRNYLLQRAQHYEHLNLGEAPVDKAIDDNEAIDNEEPKDRAIKEDLTNMVNKNQFFCIFFTSGRTIDTEEMVLVTSRSPRYYVSAAHWSRDSLLWAFPAVLMADSKLAREQLLIAFRVYAKHLGEHALYMDGRQLYPGFELDQAAAFAIALGRYVEHTQDRTILEEEVIITGVQKMIDHWRRLMHPSIDLAETFLLPSDDPAFHPYVTYDNALLSVAWEKLGNVFGTPSYLEEGKKIKDAIFSHLVVEGPFGPMFAWSSDLKGNYILYDEPPGSLELLSYYQFIDSEDKIYKNTMRWIFSPENPYYTNQGKYHGPECPHARHPWVLTICNGLLTGRVKIKDVMGIPMDSGFACETIDRFNGHVKTGAAFASCAGFLAYALNHAADQMRLGND